MTTLFEEGTWSIVDAKELDSKLTDRFDYMHNLHRLPNMDEKVRILHTCPIKQPLEDRIIPLHMYDGLIVGLYRACPLCDEKPPDSVLSLFSLYTFRALDLEFEFYVLLLKHYKDLKGKTY